MTHINNILCPLCSSSANYYLKDKNRKYFQCQNCRLVFVRSNNFLSAKEEKSRYDLHQNSPNDMGYRKFLSRMLSPMTSRLPVGSLGLDFGCGPGSTLSIMFEEAGYPMKIYDKFYATDTSVLQIKYNFVTVTEVLEHLQDSKNTLIKIWNLVKPGGYLGIMTKLVIGPKEFATWHYKNDDTHICFYSKETFNWLAKKWKTKAVYVDKDVIFFHKN